MSFFMVFPPEEYVIRDCESENTPTALRGQRFQDIWGSGKM